MDNCLWGMGRGRPFQNSLYHKRPRDCHLKYVFQSSHHNITLRIVPYQSARIHIEPIVVLLCYISGTSPGIQYRAPAPYIEYIYCRAHSSLRYIHTNTRTRPSAHLEHTCRAGSLGLSGIAFSTIQRDGGKSILSRLVLDSGGLKDLSEGSTSFHRWYTHGILPFECLLLLVPVPLCVPGSNCPR